MLLILGLGTSCWH